ncbi:hypothetical protein N7540_011143 [Penicillium herquei]|nr:hypothetical protein N7540_011143 [Penicillium herquei]
MKNPAAKVRESRWVSNPARPSLDQHRSGSVFRDEQEEPDVSCAVGGERLAMELGHHLGLDCGGYKEASQSYRGQRLARLLPKDDNFQFRSYPSDGQTRVTGSAANPSSGRLSSVEGRAQASDMDVSACGAQADHLPTQAPSAVQKSPHHQSILSIKHLLQDLDAGKDDV